MVHYFIGNLGHLLVIFSFVAAIIASVSYVMAVQKDDSSWQRLGHYGFYVHSAAVTGIFIVLFFIINRHYFEYHYAWNYSSRFLPIYYQVSSFWNGQEGSFLLWMFWNVVLGLILIRTNLFWRPSVMAVMAITQVFLASMVMGVVFFDFRLGSSPFLLLRDVVRDAVFTLNPEFVPEDGNGLNPLLQNYWMVIHPPTLFLGFAATVVPFAYAIAGLWLGKYKEWVRPALPWAQFAALILGIGILMGAYWAYETLNFGGYWNWDPVENAIYVPWLTLVAAIHMMIVYRKNEHALKAALIFTIVTFILILYSTFLTRSGILGSASVHSFTDLGLSGQLLIYLGFFMFFSVFLLIVRWKHLPVTDGEVSVYSREFWIFMGAATLGLMAFQVIGPTSYPVINEVSQLFGGNLNLATPADQVGYYSRFQLWFAIVLAILSGTGQLFWWKKMDAENLKKEIRLPIIITLLASSVLFLTARIHNVGYILLLTSSIYSIVANGKILLGLRRTNLKLSGGAIAHIGVAMMLIGILFSSGYSKILSVNYTGMVWKKDFPDEINQNNLLLFQNEARQMADYSLIYRGMRKKVESIGFVKTELLAVTDNPLELVALETIRKNDMEVAKKGDTLRIDNPENSYFEVVYRKNNGKEFVLYPRVQLNEAMGVVYSPDIKRTMFADLYTHVRTFPDPEFETEWSEIKEVTVPVGQHFFINDYAATFLAIEKLDAIPGIPLGEQDVAVKAKILIEGEYEDYTLEPMYVIKDQMAGRIPDIQSDVAAQVTILSIHPETNSFTFGIQTAQKEWIIMEAVEKPWINILWTGTLLLSIGFIVATYRRYHEFIKMRDKGMES